MEALCAPADNVEHTLDMDFMEYRNVHLSSSGLVDLHWRAICTENERDAGVRLALCSWSSVRVFPSLEASTQESRIGAG